MTGGRDSALDDDTDRWVPAAGLLRARVGSDLVVFDPVRTRVHGLNGAAGIVLDHCDGRPTAAVVEAVRAATDGRADRDEVLIVLARLTDEHVLVRAGGDRAGTVDPTATSPPPAADPVRPAPSGAAPSTAPTTPTFDALGRRTTISSEDDELVRYLTVVLGPLTVDGPPRHRYTVDPPTPERTRWQITADGGVVGHAGSASQAAAFLIWHLNHEASTDPAGRLAVHASAAARDGVAMIVPAGRDCGKSTLVAALASAGWAYLTDETSALDLDDGQLSAYPKPIALDPGSWPLLPALEPQLDPAFTRFAHRKWYVDGRTLAGGQRAPEADRVPVGHIVFPSFRSTSLILTPVTPLELALELARNTFNLAARGQRGLDLLARLATTVPGHRLPTADLPTAVALLDRLARDATRF